MRPNRLPACCFLSVFLQLIIWNPVEAQQFASLDWVQVSGDQTHFVSASRKERFQVWGVNYDHDESGRLLEEYWVDEWQTVVDDFKEIKALGANTVRIHLQIGAFLDSPTRADPEALRRLQSLVELAEALHLYLNLTGLGCYHKQDVPAWYDALSETERWNAQAVFWKQVAKACAQSPAVFCYDLMNEPIVPGNAVEDGEWLAGELGGKHFVQRLTLQPAGRTRQEIAKAWVQKMVEAIRTQDSKHLITVGVIPWVHVFPKAKPLFYSPEIREFLDFVSVHFYPESGEVEKALTALNAYKMGKPLVVEEMFPLKCSLEELDEFIQQSRGFVDGYIGFYWGKPLEAYDDPPSGIRDAILKQWLMYFKSQAEGMTRVVE